MSCLSVSFQEFIDGGDVSEQSMTHGRSQFSDIGESSKLLASHRYGLSTQKPRVLFLADKRGWAFDFEAQGIKQQLEHKFDIEIAYVREEPDLSHRTFDVIVVMFWGETYHHRFVYDPIRVIKQVASHRWANEEFYGRLTPAQFISTHLRDAATVTTISERLREAIAPYRRVFLTPQGVDTARFSRHSPRTGPLVIGWAGNAADACKGLAEIIQPATGKDFQFVMADGQLSCDEMVQFYHSIDVLCIASTAEGGPLPLIEAMAAGCFPVVVDVGIVPELVAHRRNGLIVRRSIPAFRAAFQWCILNTEWIRAAAWENAAQVARLRDIRVTICNWETALDHAISLVRDSASYEGACYLEVR